MISKPALFSLFFFLSNGLHAQSTPAKPNIILIYTDDLGYGDISAYGATKVHTPNIDKLAGEGLSFTNAHASSSTCTPSRYSLLTGKYAWRQQGTGIAPGDAALIIPTNITTLPGMLQKAGYKTAAVGKWHLGLGPAGGPDWNGDIKPGPLEIGFNYCFIMPATGDRVPCVYLENHRIVNLDPADPIQVNYKEKVGNDPTGKENPGLLKMKPSHGHDNTIVNGVSRIGWMSGGNKARWVDEKISSVLTGKAVDFINQNKNNPFFLYFATHNIHVPRMPDSAFVGKSGLGARGDAILELDWIVGRITYTLDSLGIADNTLLIFSSDNGPVIDDGYMDEAVAKLNGHTPGGPLRGGKYSAFDAGTRIPFIIRWPGKIDAGKKSDALISQLDLYASFAKLTGTKVSNNNAPDSFDELNVLLGKSSKNRQYVIEHAVNGTLSIIKDNWKYIEPHAGDALMKNTNIESGFSLQPQLYDLSKDIKEQTNLAEKYPAKAKELAALLESVKKEP